MDVARIAAFSIADMGENPAGVALSALSPDDPEMQEVAREIGAFLARTPGDGVFTRHLNQGEITVEGHASGALAAALHRQ